MQTTLLSNIELSDKFYWHGYVDFYETYFNRKEFKNIAEIGINKGASIRWLLERFPNAEIFGADILPTQPEWPKDSRFKFFQLDQGIESEVRNFFSQREFDLIIEDGSHIPQHQALAVIEGVKALKKGGIYILEDIHTSHPMSVRRSKRGLKKLLTPKGNALSVLLGIAHYKRASIKLNDEKAELIAANSLFTKEQVIFLNQNISHLSLYRRTRLPDFCTDCGSKDYSFSVYKCLCGKKIFRDYDSMSFILEK